MKKVFLEMAEDIRSAAVDHPSEPKRFKCTTRHGTRLSCKNTEEAIERMARRYDKAAKRNPLERSTRKRTESFADVFRRYVEEKDISTALALMDSREQPVYFALLARGPELMTDAKPLDSDGRFVVGRTRKGWAVTHLESGKSLGKGATKKAALEDHRRLKDRYSEKIENLVTQESCNYQTYARNYFISPKETAGA